MTVITSTNYKSLKFSKKILQVLCFDDASARRTRSSNKLGCNSDAFEICNHYLQDGYVPDSCITGNEQVATF